MYGCQLSQPMADPLNDRRYWIKDTVVMQYSDDQWGHLWSLVNDATIREVFF